MRLWTIQPWEIWEALQTQKTLLDPDNSNFADDDFRDAYDWMREQMQLRLPKYEGHYPWWAYNYKLDLRKQRFRYPPGRYVRIELKIPADRVLLSAYGAWHCVLNNWFLPYPADDAEYDRESDAWDAKLERNGFNPFSTLDLPEPWRSRIIASWQRIFDVEDLRKTNTIQACFERLNLADVVRVAEFQGKLIV